MPDHFVIAGAQRSGTTYLYGLLDEHPEIEMAKPRRPEPKFFLDDAQYALGIEHYDAQYFSDVGARLRGEKSTSYIESEKAAQRISATLPGVPVIVLVRDPVQRAVSNYRFTKRHGHEDLPLEDALRVAATGDRAWDRDRFSVSPYDYLARGRYVGYLEGFARHVGREHLEVLVFEELMADDDAIGRLYERLGVDRSFRPEGLGRVVNASDAEDVPVEPDLERWLRDYFRETNQQLAEYLGRSLPWPA